MNKVIKFLLVPLFVFCFSIIGVSAQLLSGDMDDAMEKHADKVGEKAGYAADTSLEGTVAQIISVFLGFLGIIFVGLIIYAGFNWMTSAGDSEKVTKAKDTIKRAIIGLIIIVLAYSITYTVFNQLLVD